MDYCESLGHTRLSPRTKYVKLQYINGNRNRLIHHTGLGSIAGIRCVAELAKKPPGSEKPGGLHYTERETGIEPATSSLGSLRSTPELLPHILGLNIWAQKCPVNKSNPGPHSLPGFNNTLNNAGFSPHSNVKKSQSAVSTEPGHLPLGKLPSSLLYQFFGFG